MAAMDLARFSDHAAIQEAASAGLRSMENLVRALSAASSAADLREAADFTVARFNHVISVLNRTGHARFRRARPPPEKTENCSSESESPSQNSSSTASFLSSVTAGDGSVSNGKAILFPPPPPPPAITAGKPPLAGKKRPCHDGKTNSASSNCHCHKKRKNRFRKTIRVPAISSKIANIPQDEYSWRKYGQKPIKGSPFPRGYYKCSSVKDCPAKKHVERAKDDPAMLIVTYEWEHSHPSIPTPLLPALSSSL